MTCADGTRWSGNYRWATTLTSHRRYPAAALIRLYHQGWEHETAYLSLRHTLLGGRVLRSGDPTGLRQELWALLTVYQLLRHAIVTAVEQAGRIDPDQARFTIALTTAQNLLANAANILDDTTDLTGQIGRAVLAEPAPPRRLRISARKVKSALSRRAQCRPMLTIAPGRRGPGCGADEVILRAMVDRGCRGRRRSSPCGPASSPSASGPDSAG